MITEISLLEVLSIRRDCQYLSDLKNLSKGKCVCLCREIRTIPTEAVECREWNAALTYLTGKSPAATAEEAKSALIAALQSR